MNTYEELAQSELGKEMLKAQDKANAIKQHYTKNQN